MEVDMWKKKKFVRIYNGDIKFYDNGVRMQDLHGEVYMLKCPWIKRLWNYLKRLIKGG